MAVGINADAPLLKDRLTKAGQVLDRDPRTLSRRLRQAETLVASNILARAEAHGVPLRPAGLAADLRVVGLRSERPAGRHEPVRAAGPAGTPHPPARVSIPGTASHWGQPAVAGLDGCHVSEVRRLDDFTWQVTLDLPAPVRWGQQCAIGCRFEFAPATGSRRTR